MNALDTFRTIAVVLALVILALVWLLILLVRDIARERKALQKRQEQLDFLMLAASQRRPPESAAAAMRIAEDGKPGSARGQGARGPLAVDAVDEMHRPDGMSPEASRLLDGIEEG